jgi:Saccharopine dehydrogenase NADP binding domain
MGMQYNDIVVLTKSQLERCLSIRSCAFSRAERSYVDADYLSRYEVQTVGAASVHQEYWIPAEKLDEFNAQIVVGRIDEVMSPAWQQRTDIRIVDLNTPSSLNESLAEVDVAVCAAGPFQGLPHSLLRACLKNNVAYVDANY